MKTSKLVGFSALLAVGLSSPHVANSASISSTLMGSATFDNIRQNERIVCVPKQSGKPITCPEGTYPTVVRTYEWEWNCTFYIFIPVCSV